MKSYFLLLLLASCYAHQAFSCELIMGYRTTARLPNIEAAPSNSGLYIDLYNLAVKRIGCVLKVVRLPKKRILQKMEKGEIDFYPGFSFTKPRSKNIYFIENGLPSAQVGLTRHGVNEIRSNKDLNGKTVLLAAGGPGLDLPEGVDAKKLYVSELHFEQAISLILRSRADFYKDEFGTLSYYLKDHPQQKDLKYHMNCCGGLVRLFLGFSRQSKHYQEEPNPDHNPQKEIGPYNFPIRLQHSSKAFELYKALNSLKNEGVTNSLYQKYYGNDLEGMFGIKRQ